MDEQTQQRKPNPAPAPRRFLRSPRGRVIGGVCSGLGRYFGVDPILFRVGAVALAFAGGASLFIYAALWLLVANDDGTGGASGPSPVRRLLGAADGRISVGRVALLAALVLGGLVGTMVLVLGAVLVTASGGGVWVAVAVIVIGLAAVAGALTRRRWTAWLLVPALVIAAPAGFAAAADVRFDGGGFGDRQYSPVSAAALPAHGYRVAAGRLRVDLRGLSLPAGSTTEIPIQVGIGAATIIVPSSVCVQSDSHIGAGYVDVLGDSDGGLGLHRGLDGASGSAARIVLHARVGMGALEVVHRPEEALLLDHGAGWHHVQGHPLDNAACNGAPGA